MAKEHIIVCLLLVGFSSQTCEKNTCPKENQEVFDKTQTTVPETLKLSTTEVFFIESDIRVIPNGAFAFNSQLEKVEFLNTPTESIEVGAFEGLKNVKDIEISNTPLTYLPVGTFKDMYSLEKLCLKLNKIRILEKGLFEGLRKLRDLLLQNNSITTIQEGTFDDLDNLEVLHLARNVLKSVSTSWFSKLQKLQTLRLYENQLTTIPDDLLKDLTRQAHQQEPECRTQAIYYTSLLVVQICCTLVLAKFTLSLYRLLQSNERIYTRVNLTRFSYRKDITMSPIRITETAGL
ncbi:hypothetical protein DPEC_G00273250 [Dallia pectoralis]|uniref:Uncharacterized protein n=1 Tax=Dallia pectoralis TaxID=75939 RepID=A0ACC2FQ07_DALPE|nr:hypothetical protein DPEC_G00273250 [Dallia pectoralis]